MTAHRPGAKVRLPGSTPKARQAHLPRTPSTSAKLQIPIFSTPRGRVSIISFQLRKTWSRLHLLESSPPPIQLVTP
ncbi:hypothetical protein HYQ44_016049 [Verticillium longisporum]|nr:hypothetical protein HYQ44_016049 [Verticillium longisporum]